MAPNQADEAKSAPAVDQAPAALTEQSYVGTNQCFVCHRPQTGTWSETKHAQAFTNLPENYRKDASCLQCHVTAFGKPAGFVAGTEKDLLMVGCESCHGPGALHIDAARRFVLAAPGEEEKIEKEMRETVIKAPDDSVCIKCHTTQAHGRHPPYHVQPSAQVARNAVAQRRPTLHSSHRATSSAPAWHSSRFNIKTCGSCHYERYKQWTTEAHSALSANLPAKYVNDQECSKCHPKADAVLKNPTDVQAANDNRIGAACESCHGPGLEHVHFTRRFISGPPLGPKIEEAARQSIRKGRPTTSCIQCHVGQTHKQHPEFDRNS
jgi:hypothetical protein